MRKPSHRSRAVLAAVAAALLGVAGCDAVGGNSAGGPGAARAHRREADTGLGTQPAARSPPSGDSITRGFDACTVLSDCPEVSWATGAATEVDSLAVRLLGKAGRPSAAGTTR